MEPDLASSTTSVPSTISESPDYERDIQETRQRIKSQLNPGKSFDQDPLLIGGVLTVGGLMMAYMGVNILSNLLF